MQYPIIDLIAQAYLNNGWTGLDISTGKNLLDINSSEQGGIDANGNLVSGSNLWRSTNYISVESNTEYSFSSITYFTLRVYYYTDDYSFLYRDSSGYNTLIFTTPLNCKYIKLSLYRSTEITFSDVEDGELQIELGNVRTEYEPYGSSANDFPNRLKLPLPHYFPHPVIDSLKRASEGTMTNKDREILTHYLTPLGIGGI